MAETLSNINSFLTTQSNESVIAESPEVSAYSQESVVVDTATRTYEQEIHFSNPNNTYSGKFIAINDDGTSANVLDVAEAGVGLSAEIERVNATLTTSINTVNSTLTDNIKNAKADAIKVSIDTSKTYTDTAIDSKYKSVDGEIAELSNLVVLPHINDTKVHVTKDKSLQIGLNSEFVGGKTVTDILKEASTYTQANIQTIDCGTI